MARVDNSSAAQSYDSVPVGEVDPGSHSSTASAYKRYAVYSPNEWLLEFLTSMLALGLVVALAAIFWSMDNKPLSSWNSSVSLSTSISILTTAYAIALMQGVSAFMGQAKWHHFKTRPRRLADLETFDQASRGVWGSALLLTTVKWNLATIGAAITILRLFFAPFAQQVVLLEQRDVITSPTHNIATFGYALNYSRQALFDASVAAEAVVGSFPQDAGMQSAIFQGIYGVNTSEPFSCPGLCRWPGSYTSLGFKAECRNVTQQTLSTQVCDVPADHLDEDMHHCNMTTPGGVTVRSFISPTSQSTGYYMNTTSLPIEPELAFADTFPEITRFAIYRATPDDDFYMRDTNITECSLYLTAYNYTDAKANGSDFSFTSRTEVDFGVTNPWFVWSGTPKGETGKLITNETTRGDVRIPALEIDIPNLQTLNSFFLSPAIVSEFIFGDLTTTGGDTNFGIEAALIGDVDLDYRFDKMATAMTDYVRYGPDTQIAVGEVIQSEPFVFIRWRYFALPIAIEALAIVFAVLSIFSNRRSRNVPLWKSSALAVLACQHNEQLELLQTTGKGIKEIQDEATTFRVQLQ